MTTESDSSQQHQLVFRSVPISVTKPSGVSHAFNFRKFLVWERVCPKQNDGDSEGGSDCKYVVFFSTQVQSEIEVNEKSLEFRGIKTAIDSVWHLVFGIPYGGDMRSASTSKKIAGWSDNRGVVLSNLPKPAVDIDLEFESYSIIQLREWPLPRLLRAIDGYTNASRTLQFLLELHATALATKNEDIQFTLLGKLADLCEILLPGENRSKKIASLHPFFKGRLVFDEDIFRLANTRLQTRHAAEKRDKKLHPGMTDGEKEDFRSDVDTLVRFLAFQNLGIPPTFDEGWRFPANCSVRWSGKIGKER